MNSISLEGRQVIVAMCGGQLGSLLPHVVVPSILAAFLNLEWRLSGAWGVGGARDSGGGPLQASAWMAACSVLAVSILFGPAALYWSRRTALQP